MSSHCNLVKSQSEGFAHSQKEERKAATTVSERGEGGGTDLGVQGQSFRVSDMHRD